MANRLADLTLRLTADSKQLQSELRKVEGANRSTTKRVESEWRSLSKGIGGLAGTFTKLAGAGGILGGLSFAGLQSLASDAVDSADALDALAGKLGISTTALQEYRYAAGQSGVEQAQLDASLLRFGKVIGEAAVGIGRGRAALEALGVSVRGAGGEVRSIESVFEDVVRALDQVEGASVRTALAQRIFGESGAGIVALSGDFDELMKRARDLGIAIDEDVVASMARMKDASDELDQVLKQRLSGSMSVIARLGLAIKGGFVQAIEALDETVAGSSVLSNAFDALLPLETIDDLDTLNDRLEDTKASMQRLNALILQTQKLGPGAGAGLSDQLFAAMREAERIQDRIDQVQAGPAAAPVSPDKGSIRVGSLKTSSMKDEQAAKIQEPKDTFFAESAREYEAAQTRLNAVLEAGFGPSQRLLTTLDQLGVDYREGLISTDEFAQGQAALALELDELEAQSASTSTAMQQDFSQLGYAGMGVVQGLSAELTNFLTTGEANFKTFAQSVIAELTQIAIRQAILGTVTKVFGGALFGGFLAEGGPAMPGRPYVVGEKGPELFVPKSAGFVVPNGGHGGAPPTVPAAGGSSRAAPVVVNINNSTSSNVQASHKTGPDGQREIEVFVTDMIARNISRGGSVGKAMERSLGVRPRGV